MLRMSHVRCVSRDFSAPFAKDRFQEFGNVNRRFDPEFCLCEIQPDFHPDVASAQPGNRVFISDIVARKKDPRGPSGLAQELDGLAFGGVHHRGLKNALAILEEDARAAFKDRPGSGDGVLRYVVGGTPGVEYDAGGLVFEDCSRSFLRDSGQNLADFREELPLGIIELEFCRTGA